MKKKLLFIGGDSFIAQNFIIRYKNTYDIEAFSKNATNSINEFVIDDFALLQIKDSYDTVINFAAIVHRPDIKDEKVYDGVNHKLAILNAQKAKQAGVKLFIQMSSIAVYGNVSIISIDTPYYPQNPYGKSKLKADEELLAMQDENFKVAIVRPPMVYGGGKAPGNMMRLIRLADKGIPLPFKDIDNKRDFIHVQNLIQYLAVIAEKQLSGIHLITDQQPVSTEYLLNTISTFFEKKALLLKVPNWILRALKTLRPHEFEKLFGSLQVETNFPFEDQIIRYSVEEGIREMVKWYKSNKV